MPKSPALPAGFVLEEDLPPLPPGFELEGASGSSGSPARQNRRAKDVRSVHTPPPPPGFIDEAELRASGRVHDGDTFGLTNGQNARLSGADAFEQRQQGYRRDGSPVPIGRNAFDFLSGQITQNALIMDTGQRSYNRPVVIAQNGGQDIGSALISSGNALAVPRYLQGDPRMPDYMEAERLARLNRRGAHAGVFQDPADFRRGEPDPWAEAEMSPDGKGVAIFPDEPTPFQGLRPEIAEGYVALASDLNSTAEQLVGYAKANGFKIDPAEARAFIKKRNSGAKVTDQIQYEQLPPALTDMKDGVVGAAARGFVDPINMLDEVAGVGDALGVTDGRENIWNSDRRFGDILWNNIDQNRAILNHDDAEHPWARLGGQLASGFIAPGLSVEGVGLAAGREVLRQGGTMAAARAAAKGAVTRRLGAAGAIEGGLAGFGAGEGNPLDRLDDAALGASLGAATGVTAGALAPYAVQGGRKLKGAVRSRLARNSEPSGDVGEDIPPLPEGFVEEGAAPGSFGGIDPDAVEGGSISGGRQSPIADQPRAIDSVEPTEQTAGRVAAMSDDLRPATISADVVDEELPPLPDGFVLEEPDLSPRAKVRPVDQRATPEEIAAIARGVNPEDVRPIPASAVETLDDALKANPGTIRDAVAPDERKALPSYKTAGGANRRDPMDLVSWLRANGGIQDQGTELSRMGVDNKPRDLEFAKSEGFLGKLVRDDGMTLDEAARAAWERGYFPDHAERPTISEFLDAVRATYNGASGRVFHPSDFDAIDAYRTAKAERERIEAAAEEGIKLAEDVGEEVTLDDLDKNAAPVTAYEDLPAIGGKAGNIRIDKLETRADIRRALMTTDAKVGGFDAARRGKISQAETEALASELRMTADDLLKRRQGQALNAEQALAARSILAKSADELVTLAKKVKGGSDEELAAFRRAWVRHVAIQEQVSGATAEAGRALAQFKMMAKSRAAQGRIHQALVEGGGGKDRLEEVAQTLIDLQRDPGSLNSFTRQALKPKLSDKLVELWYNSILSGPQTHAVNILSNSITSALQIPEHLTAAALGQFRRRAADRVLLSEVGARTVGLMQGTKEGLRAFARTAKTGQVPDHVTKVEAASQEAISGLKGKVIRIPTRMLSAEDELFKAMARRMEISGLAMRQARGERLKGDAFQKRVAELTANPTDEMVEKSLDYGRYLTFQRPLGPIGQSVTRITSEWPALKLFLPFIRTPTNIFKFAIERSPAAPVLKEVRRDFAKGGAARDLAAAKMMLGTGLGMLAAQWAADGTITGGGPADDGARALLRADGWQPYSIKLGDRYYSYQRFDPIASTLGVAADMVETSDYMTEAQREKTAATVIAAVVKNLSNKVWLTGITDIAQAIDDPDRYLDSLVARLAGSVAVPAVVAQAKNAVDPVSRATTTPGERIMSRVPGLSSSLPPKRDLWGEEITSEDRVGPDILSPVMTSTAKNDPVVRELLEIDARIGPLPKKVGDRKLTPEEYSEYQRLAGGYLREGLEEAMASDWWRIAPPDRREDMVERIKREARRDARSALGF